MITHLPFKNGEKNVGHIFRFCLKDIFYQVWDIKKKKNVKNLIISIIFIKVRNKK
eukprot:UN25829